jgi:hypothetical protein
MAAPRVDDLARSFERYLRAGNKWPRTIETYLEAVAGFSGYLAATSRRLLNRPAGCRGLDRGPPGVLEAVHHPQLLPRPARLLPLAGSGRGPPQPMAKMKPPAVPDVPIPILGARWCCIGPRSGPPRMRFTTCLWSGTSPPAGSAAMPPPGPRPRGHPPARPRRGRCRVVSEGELGGRGRAGRAAGVASVSPLVVQRCGGSTPRAARGLHLGSWPVASFLGADLQVRGT